MFADFTIRHISPPSPLLSQPRIRLIACSQSSLVLALNKLWSYDGRTRVPPSTSIARLISATPSTMLSARCGSAAGPPNGDQRLQGASTVLEASDGVFILHEQAPDLPSRHEGIVARHDQPMCVWILPEGAQKSGPWSSRCRGCGVHLQVRLVQAFYL